MRPDSGHYDCIIVGGGAAGCVLASRLSEAPQRRVLLLEAGADTPPGDEPADVVDLYPRSYYNPANLWPGLVAHWRTRADGPAVPFSQGRIMGGGSSVMGMVAFRGTPDDYAEWQELGAVGWDWAGVLPYFRKLERDMDFAGDQHGAEGRVPVRRVEPAQWPSLTRAIQQYCASRGIPYVADMNADFRDGFGSTPLSNTTERRASSAYCYLDAAVRARPNLEIRSRTMVRRLRFDGRRVIGVQAVSGGEASEIRAAEVIVSCGSIFSPLLLMRSGIGPADELRQRGIGVVADLPGVGRNLSNHPILFVGMRLAPGQRQSPSLRTHPTCCLRYSSGRPSCPSADMYLNIQSKSSWNRVGDQVANLSTVLLKPLSRGQVSLGSSVDAAPCIEFNFASETPDLERLMDGFAKVVAIALSEEVAPLLSGAPFPVRYTDRIRKLNKLTATNRVRSALIARSMDLAPSLGNRLLAALIGEHRDLSELIQDRSALAEHVRRNVAGVYHPVGSCRMGAPGDPASVVDSTGRVIGLGGLRVVDASIMPTLPRGNTNLPTLMLAEKLADCICGR